MIHADMTYCSLFVLFNFCTTWLFPFLQKTTRYRSAQFATVVHNSVTTSFCTPWIPFCLFPCAKFLFFYTIYFGDRRMCWIMYWWLQTIRNCCCFKNNMRKCFILKFFCRSFFVKCVSTENNKTQPTISDKCSVFWMCDLTRARIGTLMQCKICLWKVTEMHISV